jgi:putative Mg2+ transporter-C (MgtC) family protein
MIALLPLATLLSDEQIRAWGQSHGQTFELFLRLTMAIVAGGLVGLEREMRGRQAGFRTTILVCLGSALVMIVSISFASRPWPHDPSVIIRVDPARIAYGVMMGIGFLGAGTIIKSGARVHGLTTAAALWTMAAVGLAAGFGMYLMTAITTMLVLVTLFVLDYFEDSFPKLRYRDVVIRREWRPGCIEETVQLFQDANLRVVDASFRRSSDLAFADISLRVAFHNRRQYYTLQRRLEEDQRYILLAAEET